MELQPTLRKVCFPHFTGEKTEAQRMCITNPRPQSWPVSDTEAQHSNSQDDRVCALACAMPYQRCKAG